MAASRHFRQFIFATETDVNCIATVIYKWNVCYWLFNYSIISIYAFCLPQISTNIKRENTYTEIIGVTIMSYLLSTDGIPINTICRK